MIMTNLSLSARDVCSNTYCCVASMPLMPRRLAAIAHRFLRLGHSSDPCKAVDTHVFDEEEAEKQAAEAEKQAAHDAANKLRWENIRKARKEPASGAALMK